MDNDLIINQNSSEENKIDIMRMATALLNKLWLIILVAVIFAVGAYMGTKMFVTPLYQSSAMFYVNNSSIDVGSVSISGGDISTAKTLVNSYIVILKTRQTLNEVIDYADVDLSYGQLKGMISASSVNGTEIFQVVVTSDDPEEAKKVTDAIAYLLPKRIGNIIEGTSAKVVDPAVVPTSPVSPSYTSNATKGFAVGLVLMAGLIVVLELLDITIRKEEDISRSCTHPVLAAVPDMESHSKGGYYGYGKKQVYDTSKPKKRRHLELVGGNISFAAAESYKLLRTKLQFSFADESNCRVIGISSALHGEGKSLSAVNLAYSLSQLGKRVLLIDSDMRRPTVADKLPIHKTPGLSDFLSGQNQADNMIQCCGIRDEEQAFHAISSGITPPNPMELLSSARMEKLLADLRESYDYVILDLPPVGEVGDALAVSKFTDGMLIVVRQNYCDRIALNTAVRQFEFVDAKILGVVFNCTNEDGSSYGKKHYRGKYMKKYYNKYRHYDSNGRNGGKSKKNNG